MEVCRETHKAGGGDSENDNGSGVRDDQQTPVWQMYWPGTQDC